MYSGTSRFIEPVIYVDGGANFKDSNRGFSVGDNDSFDGKLDITIPKIKSYSDLCFVLNQIKDQFNKVNLLGFLGKRKDHELINLLEVHRFLTKHTRKIKVSFDQQILAYSLGNWEENIQGIFSVIAFEKIDIEIKGDCDYTQTLENEFKHLSSHGLSNNGHGVVIFKASNVFFLFLND